LGALIYYLVLPFIYLLSLLPFPVLYLFSDLLFPLFYYVIGYRKKVVFKNLRNAFPEKTDKEIKKIAMAFFHYLCDLFLETFKTLTISKETMLKHCAMDPDAEALFAKMAAENKSIILVMGHMGNWEWAGNTFSLTCPQQLFVIYHPIANKYFNGLMHDMRSRFGSKLIPMKDTFRQMLANRRIVNSTAFIADQTPLPDNAYWTTFLNQETPVFKGTGLIAKKLNLPVIYVNIQRIKRGYYVLNAEMLIEDPATLSEDDITEMHTKRLEQDIIAQPETWLWSHKRWKHKRPVA